MNSHAERVVIDQASPVNLNYFRHLAGYRFVQRYLRKGSVLEVGCGGGYGIALLAAKRRNTFVAVDIDVPTVKRAKGGSADDTHVHYCAASGTTLTFRDNAFELTFALQVIEHLSDQHRFFHELLRVTKSGGIIIISTPNKVMYAKENEGRTNPFHVREFEREEFIGFLEEFNVTFVVKGIAKSDRLRNVEKTIECDRGTPVIRIIKRLGLLKWAPYVPLFLKRLLVEATKTERLMASGIDASDYIVTDTPDDAALDFFAVIYA